MKTALPTIENKIDEAKQANVFDVVYVRVKANH